MLCLNYLLLLNAVTFMVSNADEWNNLKQKLFEGYDPGVRPMCGANNKTMVTLGVALRQLLSLDSPSQVISINVWMRQNWMDCRLGWNETEYGISHVQVPVERVWTPDLTVYDATGSASLPGIRDYRAKIYSNGRVSYNWPTIISSFCALHVENFPMDKQKCRFIYTSWVYDGGEIDWAPMFKTGDLSSYEENAEWMVEKYVPERHSAMYACCPNPFVDLTFSLHIRRRALHYVISLIFPCVLISALTQLGFILPVESGEKVSLQITVMLSLAVFLLVISEQLPPSADSIPLVGLYFALTLVLVTVSCSITVVVVHVHFKSSSRVPTWVRRIVIDKIGKFLLVQRRDMHERKTPNTSNIYSTVGNTIHNNNLPLDEMSRYSDQNASLQQRRASHFEGFTHSDIQSEFQKFVSTFPNGLSNDGSSEMNASRSDIAQQLREQSAYLQTIAKHFDDADNEEVFHNEWHNLARVVDRIFFFICMSFLVGSTVTLFVRLGD